LEYTNSGGNAIDHKHLIDAWDIDVTAIETVRSRTYSCTTLLTTAEPWTVSALKRKFDMVQYMRDTNVYIGSTVSITPKASPAFAAKANMVKRILKSPGEMEEVVSVWDAFGTMEEPPTKRQRSGAAAAETLLQMSRDASDDE
jgi:hypothetical protein